MSLANIQIADYFKPQVSSEGSGFFFSLTWGIIITVVFVLDAFLELREAFATALETTDQTDFWDGLTGTWLIACITIVLVLEESKHFAWPLWDLMKGNFAVMEVEEVEEEEEIMEEEEFSYDTTDCDAYEGEDNDACWNAYCEEFPEDC
jgi:hypothetical protein